MVFISNILHSISGICKCSWKTTYFNSVQTFRKFYGNFLKPITHQNTNSSFLKADQRVWTSPSLQWVHNTCRSEGAASATFVSRKLLDPNVCMWCIRCSAFNLPIIAEQILRSIAHWRGEVVTCATTTLVAFYLHLGQRQYCTARHSGQKKNTRWLLSYGIEWWADQTWHTLNFIKSSSYICQAWSCLIPERLPNKTSCENYKMFQKTSCRIFWKFFGVILRTFFENISGNLEKKNLW